MKMMKPAMKGKATMPKATKPAKVVPAPKKTTMKPSKKMY